MKFKKTLLLAFLTLGTASSYAKTIITKVEYKSKQSPHQLIITAKGPLKVSKEEYTKEKQILLEFDDAKLENSNAARSLDLSSIKGKVSLITPYEVKDQNKVRVILQLRENVPVDLVTQGSQLTMAIDGTVDQAKVSKAQSSSEISAKTAEKLDQLSAEKQIDTFLKSKDSKKYVGKNITLQVKGAELRDVLQMVGETSGFNIIYGDDVAGNITLSLVDIPWDLALDTILSLKKLGAEKQGSILRVALLANLQNEKKEEIALKQAEASSLPKVTRIFPVSHADINTLKTTVEDLMKSSNLAQYGSSLTTSLLIDKNSNSLIAQDIQSNIDRISKIIELLDKPIPQVLIEAKVVEANEGFAESLGGSLGLGRSYPQQEAGGDTQLASFNQGLLTLPDISSDTPSGAFGVASTIYSPVRALTGFSLAAFLSLNEKQNKSKVISSPRVIVLNNENATLVQGQPVLLGRQAVTGAGGSVTESDNVQTANLSLTVKPTVSNDNSIMMDLNIQSDNPQKISSGSSAVGTRSVKTKVQTESGSTVVVGGIYTDRTIETEQGFPVLKDIPIIGTLFGSKSKDKTKTELFVFITPKVLNEESKMDKTDLQ